MFLNFYNPLKVIKNMLFTLRMCSQKMSLPQNDQHIMKKPEFGLFKFGDYKVDVKGTCDEPYFNGKEICKILEYSNFTKALQMHVDSEDKKPLSEVSPISFLTYNEGKAVYISEPGLYSLILKSKMQAAKQFKKEHVMSHTLMGKIFVRF